MTSLRQGYWINVVSLTVLQLNIISCPFRKIARLYVSAQENIVPISFLNTFLMKRMNESLLCKYPIANKEIQQMVSGLIVGSSC